MRVYVLLEVVAYEGSDILNIYATEALAENAREVKEKEYPSDRYMGLNYVIESHDVIGDAP